VEQPLFVQQRISEDPGHKPEVTLPEQQPAETETQTPSIPPTLQKQEIRKIFIIFRHSITYLQVAS
jgi:hypothetical protein